MNFLDVGIAAVGIAAIGGVLAGAFYYGGLWWTLQRLANATRPALLLGMSFLVRTVVVLLALLWLTDLQFTLILVFMAGFIVMRLVLTQRLGPRDHAGGAQNRVHPAAKGEGHGADA
jgi:F1F0 ATPase subunit 2